MMQRPMLTLAALLLSFCGTGSALAQVAAAPAAPAAELTREQKMLLDWPNLARYHAADLSLETPLANGNRVVFYGDSITDAWDLAEYFPGKPYVNRGISGQTTPQMLVRFRQDVIDLKPKVVIILAGTNDIAGNTGPTTPEAIHENFESMTELALANNIRVVLASVLPAYDYPWKPGLEPAEKIVALNVWLKDYAASKGVVYLDYFTPMANEKHGMKAELSGDGVHPNKAGYLIMQPLAERAIAQAMQAVPAKAASH
jgi:acyl-CoA thioesterase I